MLELLSQELFSLFLQLGLKRSDIINEVLSDCFNLILVNLELDQDVSVLTLAPRELLLVQVDDHVQALDFSIIRFLNLFDARVRLDLLFFPDGFLVCLVPLNLVEVGLLDSQSLPLQTELNRLDLCQVLLMHVRVFGLELRDEDLVASVDVFDLERLARLHHLKLFNTHVQILQLAFLFSESFSLSLKISTNGNEFLAKLCANTLSLNDYLVLVLRLQSCLIFF